MNIFLSLFFSILMLFGTGSTREKALSAKYQDGSWSGSSIGIPAAYVENGMLYVDGKLANFPADSSVSYSVKPLVTTNRGTWFLDKSQTNSVCIFRLDSRGYCIQEWDFSSKTFGSEKVVVSVDEENEEILLEVTYSDKSHKGIRTYHIEFDPDDQSRLPS